MDRRTERNKPAMLLLFQARKSIVRYIDRRKNIDAVCFCVLTGQMKY